MFPVYCRNFLIGNLSRDALEPRTSTGSCIFPSLERFDATAFVTSIRRHKNKSFPVHGKEQNHAKKENIRLPVASVAQKRLCLSSLMSVGEIVVWCNSEIKRPRNVFVAITIARSRTDFYFSQPECGNNNKNSMFVAGRVTLGNNSCNSCRNKFARQVARKLAKCNSAFNSFTIEFRRGSNLFESDG